MFGEEYDLTDVVSVVADLAVDGLHHGVRLGADGDGTGQILILQSVECIETNLPPSFPQGDQTRTSLRRSFKFGVAVAIRLFAVAGQKIGPTRAHIAGHVLDDDGDGVGFGVEGDKEVVIGTLFDGAIAEALVITEEVASVLSVGGCELV